MKKPKVDLIEGLSPAISIEQKNTSRIRDRLLLRLLKSMIICVFYTQELEHHFLRLPENQ